jgi:hypothetical protein
MFMEQRKGDTLMAFGAGVDSVGMGGSFAFLIFLILILLVVGFGWFGVNAA